MGVALDTEIEIIATLTSDAACRKYYDDGLHDYHFSDAVCKKAFSFALDYFATHGALTTAPTAEVIENEVNGYSELASMAKGAAPSYLSERLKNDYVRRETQDMLRTFLPMISESPLEAAKMLRDTLGIIVENCVPDEFCIEYGKDMEAYRKRVAEQQAMTGVPYPFPEMTEETGGIRDGEMCILVGPPGMGKTCFACKAALEAMRAGIDVYFASLELSIENIAQRIEYMVANDGEIGSPVTVPVMDWQRGIRLPQYDKAINDAQEKIAALPGRLVIDQPSMDDRTPSALVQRCKSNDCGFIIVDQLQFVTKPKRDSLQESYGAALQEFKQHVMTPADGRRLPLLLLHQMNREGVKNQSKGAGKVGNMTGIAGSAWVEQIADIVWGIGRNKEEQNNSIMNIATLKVRNTAPCGFMLHWDTSYSYRFAVVHDESGNPIRLDDWQ